jgi:predicted hotdog family 3-hydroxylacyl-ACP dehydratase
LIDYTDIASLIPHSGAMVLLDKVFGYDSESLCAELLVRGDGLLGDAYSVPAWVGIEYMAQTIAAYSGIRSKLAGEPIKLGFLLGTRRYTSNISRFSVGTTLSIQIKNIMEDERLGVFDCRLRGDGIAINANLNVYQPPLEIQLHNQL